MQKSEDKKHQKFKRKRKPKVVFICEGRNKTEKLFFDHFNKRENAFRIKTIRSEATDPISMIKKAKWAIQEEDLSKRNSDMVFCLIDLDLSQSKLEAIRSLKINNNLIKIIISNPCFEIWLLYYFTKYPQVNNASKKVKEQLKKFVQDYTENMDIVQEYKLEDKHLIALNNAELRNALEKGKPLIERNPYTEIPEVIMYLEVLKNNF